MRMSEVLPHRTARINPTNTVLNQKDTVYKVEREAKWINGIKTQDGNHFAGGPVEAINGHKEV